MRRVSRIPSARTGADPTVTGSIPKESKGKSEPKQVKGVTSAPTSPASLMNPQSIAEQPARSEPASVFNLFSTQKPD